MGRAGLTPVVLLLLVVVAQLALALRRSPPLRLHHLLRLAATRACGASEALVGEVSLEAAGAVRGVAAAAALKVTADGEVALRAPEARVCYCC